jgi:carbon storage regulator
MLVLSRRERQRIKLGDSIIVTVVRVSGDKVRLGIEAPADVLVLRDELEPIAPIRPALPIASGATAAPAAPVGPATLAAPEAPPSASAA